MTETTKKLKITPESLLKFATLVHRVDQTTEDTTLISVSTGSLEQLSPNHSKRFAVIRKPQVGTLLKLKSTNKKD